MILMTLAIGLQTLVVQVNFILASLLLICDNLLSLNLKVLANCLMPTSPVLASFWLNVAALYNDLILSGNEFKFMLDILI